MSGILYYARLLDGGTRVRAFEEAIRERVRTGDRVLDLGTGLGTFAFFAARAGAEHVWGVDSDPVIHTAEQLAAANGLADRVTFVRGRVPSAFLPPRIDVLIFEDFPCTLLDDATYRLLCDVIATTLAPGGRMIPMAARMNVAPVQSEALRGQTFPIGEGEPDRHGLDWAVLRPLLANAPRREQLGPEHLLAAPLRSPIFSMIPLPGPERLRIEGAWSAVTPGRIDALALWFELEVSPDNWISNEPRLDPEPWGQWILPIDPPLEIASPGQVHAAVGREALPDGGHGWLTWEVRWNAEVRRGHEFAGLTVGLEDVSNPGA